MTPMFGVVRNPSRHSDEEPAPGLNRGRNPAHHACRAMIGMNGCRPRAPSRALRLSGQVQSDGSAPRRVPLDNPVPVRQVRAWRPAASPPRLAATQLPSARGSHHQGPQRTSTSSINAIPGAQASRYRGLLASRSSVGWNGRRPRRDRSCCSMFELCALNLALKARSRWCQ